jgi:hypothetical protein
MTRREFGTALVGGAVAASLFPGRVGARRDNPLRVNGDRLNARLAEVGRFGANTAATTPAATARPASRRGRWAAAGIVLAGGVPCS